MLQFLHIINILLPVIYAFALGTYIYDFFTDSPKFLKMKRIILIVTVFIHITYILVRTVQFDHPPITNKFEIFTILAFSLVFSYLILELLTDIKETGGFILLMAFIFQLISSLFIEDLTAVKEVLRSRLLGLHVSTAILGYAGFTISAVYGILFLVMFKQIRHSKFGLLFNKMPNLEILEKLSFNALLIGFSSLTFAIIVGSIWLPSAFPDFSYSDPKLISTFFVWLIYFVGIFYKISSGWYGRKIIYFSITGFAVAILSLIASNIFSDSFHSFY